MSKVLFVTNRLKRSVKENNKLCIRNFDNREFILMCNMERPAGSNSLVSFLAAMHPWLFK